MSAHIELWLDAYLDGELPGAKARQVEAHLSECPGCRALVEQRRSLSALLQDAPAARLRKSPDRFVAEVRLQMRPQPRHSLSTRQALRLTWIATPVLLMLAWVFIQSTLWVSALVSFIPGASQALLVGAERPAALPFSLPPAAGELLSFALPLDLLNWNILTGLALLLVIGLLYLGWLAGWWVRTRQNDQSID